eukprot:scaffold217883_cov46-Prasinocladus_malaysianus.AAC.2
MILGLIIPSASLIHGDMVSMESPEYQAFLAATCAATMAASSISTSTSTWLDPCKIAWGYKDVIALFVASTSIFANGMTMLLRIEMWAPAFVHAVDRTGNRRMKRYAAVRTYVQYD